MLKKTHFWEKIFTDFGWPEAPACKVSLLVYQALGEIYYKSLTWMIRPFPFVWWAFSPLAFLLKNWWHIFWVVDFQKDWSLVWPFWGGYRTDPLTKLTYLFGGNVPPTTSTHNFEFLEVETISNTEIDILRTQQHQRHRISSNKWPPHRNHGCFSPPFWNKNVPNF